MKKRTDLIKIKGDFPFNYHNIKIEKHKTARIIDTKDSLAINIPNLQNSKAFYRSFYKTISRFI